MNRIVSHLVLPSEISEFEQSYLRKTNRVALWFFALHVPIVTAIAFANHTNGLLALGLTLAVLLGPLVAHSSLSSLRVVSMVHGVAAMFFGALLVHFGQGPMQIEMHFYFFALIACLAVFGNPLVIVSAAVTVALHHLALWFLAPASVFNYDAPVWVVSVHALFVVLESVAACFIARSFFDNVIGLERIVRTRTRELDARNADMRLVLDNVDQALVTIDREGRLARERSLAFGRWFGASATSLFEAFEARSADFASRSRVGWDQLVEGTLPAALLLDQLPRTLTDGETTYDVRYFPIGDCETAERFLVVVTDVSAAVARERSEAERAEVLTLFEHTLGDRAGVFDFCDEANALVAGIVADADDIVTVKRHIHTLKGISGIFGLHTVVRLCHELESFMVEDGGRPRPALLAKLRVRWNEISDCLRRLLEQRVIELTTEEHQALERDARRVSSEWFSRIHELKLQKTKSKLELMAEQARRLAERLEKEVAVTVEHHDLRVDADHWAPFWGVLVHAVRNAVDHGLETPEERAAAGKPTVGALRLVTEKRDDRVVVEVTDDGRGIDWAALRDKAKAAGLPAEMPVEEVLFQDGVTTAEMVTDVSGRGIGMAALREMSRAMGGVLSIESRSGQGTTVSISFPPNAMMSEPPALAA